MPIKQKRRVEDFHTPDCCRFKSVYNKRKSPRRASVRIVVVIVVIVVVAVVCAVTVMRLPSRAMVAYRHRRRLSSPGGVVFAVVYADCALC